MDEEFFSQRKPKKSRSKSRVKSRYNKADPLNPSTWCHNASLPPLSSPSSPVTSPREVKKKTVPRPPVKEQSRSVPKKLGPMGEALKLEKPSEAAIIGTYAPSKYAFAKFRKSETNSGKDKQLKVFDIMLNSTPNSSRVGSKFIKLNQAVKKISNNNSRNTNPLDGPLNLNPFQNL